MNMITVLLVAGGDSERFWPLSEKHFTSFLGRPLVWYTLKQLQKFGFKRIVIVTNTSNEDLFIRLIADFPDLTIQLVLQSDLRGIGGAVLSAEKFIQEQELLLIGPSDVYEDILFSDFQQMYQAQPEGILAGTFVNDYFPGGYLTVRDTYVASIVEKPHPNKTPSNIVTFMFDYFRDSNKLLTTLKKVKSRKDDFFEVAIQSLLSQIHMRFLPYKGYWGYLKYPWHVLHMTEHFFGKVQGAIEGNTTIASSASIAGDVYLAEGVKVFENAKIIGPAYIGRGTIVGNQAMIRQSHIGENCVVGFGTEVARSYIGNSCWFHSNYIGDSVLANNIGIGAGAVLANFRLDEGMVHSMIKKTSTPTGKIKLGAMIGNNTRIGVNASIMPGVKIGSGCFVGAGIVLSGDLPNDQYCWGAYTMKITRNKKAVGTRSKSLIKTAFR